MNILFNKKEKSSLNIKKTVQNRLPVPCSRERSKNYKKNFFQREPELIS